MDKERGLVEQILAGDGDAFARLIQEYKGLVVNIVYRMVLRPEVREDICQEVFMKVYKSLAGFRFESKLSTWIARVAYNTGMNHLDKKREVLLDESMGGPAALDGLPGNFMLPDEAAEETDLSLRLRAEIEHLPAAYRTVLTLYHLEGLSYSEIGEVMDLPEGTVKSHLFRARKRLRARLLSRYRREDLWS